MKAQAGLTTSELLDKLNKITGVPLSRRLLYMWVSDSLIPQAEKDDAGKLRWSKAAVLACEERVKKQKDHILKVRARESHEEKAPSSVGVVKSPVKERKALQSKTATPIESTHPKRISKGLAPKVDQKVEVVEPVRPLPRKAFEPEKRPQYQEEALVALRGKTAALTGQLSRSEEEKTKLEETVKRLQAQLLEAKQALTAKAPLDAVYLDEAQAQRVVSWLFMQLCVNTPEARRRPMHLEATWGAMDGILAKYNLALSTTKDGYVLKSSPKEAV